MANAPPTPAGLLTPRQLEVLELVAKGLTNADIARVLGISPATAKHHVAHVIAALEVTNRTEAAMELQKLELGRSLGRKTRLLRCPASGRARRSRYSRSTTSRAARATPRSRTGWSRS